MGAEQIANALAERLEGVEKVTSNPNPLPNPNPNPNPNPTPNPNPNPNPNPTVEKDKEAQLRRLQAQKKEVERYGSIYEDLKRELEIVQASAAAV